MTHFLLFVTFADNTQNTFMCDEYAYLGNWLNLFVDNECIAQINADTVKLIEIDHYEEDKEGEVE